MRFERTAFGVGVQRSIQLSYGYIVRCGNLPYCTAKTGRMSIENCPFFYYSVSNRIPRVLGPQWQEIVQLALVT